MSYTIKRETNFATESSGTLASKGWSGPSATHWSVTGGVLTLNEARNEGEPEDSAAMPAGNEFQDGVMVLVTVPQTILDPATNASDDCAPYPMVRTQAGSGGNRTGYGVKPKWGAWEFFRIDSATAGDAIGISVAASSDNGVDWAAAGLIGQTRSLVVSLQAETVAGSGTRLIARCALADKPDVPLATIYSVFDNTAFHQGVSGPPGITAWTRFGARPSPPGIVRADCYSHTASAVAGAGLFDHRKATEASALLNFGPFDAEVEIRDAAGQTSRKVPGDDGPYYTNNLSTWEWFEDSTVINGLGGEVSPKAFRSDANSTGGMAIQQMGHFRPEGGTAAFRLKINSGGNWYAASNRPFVEFRTGGALYKRSLTLSLDTGYLELAHRDSTGNRTEAHDLAEVVLRCALPLGLTDASALSLYFSWGEEGLMLSCGDYEPFSLARHSTWASNTGYVPIPAEDMNPGYFWETGWRFLHSANSGWSVDRIAIYDAQLFPGDSLASGGPANTLTIGDTPTGTAVNQRLAGIGHNGQTAGAQAPLNALGVPFNRFEKLYWLLPANPSGTNPGAGWVRGTWGQLPGKSAEQFYYRDDVYARSFGVLDAQGSGPGRLFINIEGNMELVRASDGVETWDRLRSTPPSEDAGNPTAFPTLAKVLDPANYLWHPSSANNVPKNDLILAGWYDSVHRIVNHYGQAGQIWTFGNEPIDSNWFWNDADWNNDGVISAADYNTAPGIAGYTARYKDLFKKSALTVISVDPTAKIVIGEHLTITAKYRDFIIDVLSDVQAWNVANPSQVIPIHGFSLHNYGLPKAAMDEAIADLQTRAGAINAAWSNLPVYITEFAMELGLGVGNAATPGAPFSTGLAGNYQQNAYCAAQYAHDLITFQGMSDVAGVCWHALDSQTFGGGPYGLLDNEHTYAPFWGGFGMWRKLDGCSVLPITSSDLPAGMQVLAAKHPVSGKTFVLLAYPRYRYRGVAAKNLHLNLPDALEGQSITRYEVSPTKSNYRDYPAGGDDLFSASAGVVGIGGELTLSMEPRSVVLLEITQGATTSGRAPYVTP